jgi:hypothetical protein
MPLSLTHLLATDNHVNMVTTADIIGRGDTTSWFGHSIWVSSHTVPLFNIWYFAARMMPMFAARRRSEEGVLGIALPPLTSDDIVYIPSPSEVHVASEWERVFTQVAAGLDDVRLEYKDSPYMRQLDNTGQMVCLPHAVILGGLAYVVRQLTAADRVPSRG